MKAPLEGSKEFQVRNLRLKRASSERSGRTQTAAKSAKPINAPVQASAPKETSMKKSKKKAAKPAGKKRSRSEASANLKAAKVRAVSTGEANKFKVVLPKKPKAARTTVPAIEVAAFMAREGGAAMADLEKEFGIDAHPMRAKIHYVRHKLGWTVETKDGRYFATAPKAA